MQTIITPKCKYCLIPCKKSTALHNPNLIIKDNGFDRIFPKQSKAVQIDCWKCPECGHSFTI